MFSRLLTYLCRLATGVGCSVVCFADCLAVLQGCCYSAKFMQWVVKNKWITFFEWMMIHLPFPCHGHGRRGANSNIGSSEIIYRTPREKNTIEKGKKQRENILGRYRCAPRADRKTKKTRGELVRSISRETSYTKCVFPHPTVFVESCTRH